MHCFWVVRSVLYGCRSVTLLLNPKTNFLGGLVNEAFWKRLAATGCSCHR